MLVSTLHSGLQILLCPLVKVVYKFIITSLKTRELSEL